MRNRRTEIPPGSSVIVYQAGHAQPATLLGYVSTVGGREARVRIEGQTTPQTVAIFAVSRPPKKARWWPESSTNRAAIIGIVVAVLAAVPSYFTWFGGDSDSDGGKVAAPAATAPLTTTTPHTGTGQVDGGNANYSISDTTDGAPFRNPAIAHPWNRARTTGCGSLRDSGRQVSR